MDIPHSTYFALVVAATSCASTEKAPVYPNVVTPIRRGESREAPPEQPVRAVLVACETVLPIGLEVVLPDGHSFDVSMRTSDPARLRLHVQLENVGAHDVLVANCNGVLRIIDVDAPRPDCQSPEPPWPSEQTWASLPSGGTMMTYPTIPKPNTTGVFTETLQPQLGHAPYTYWRTHVPEAIFFRLTPTTCQPLTAAEASAEPWPANEEAGDF